MSSVKCGSCFSSYCDSGLKILPKQQGSTFLNQPKPIFLHVITQFKENRIIHKKLLNSSKVNNDLYLQLKVFPTWMLLKGALSLNKPYDIWLCGGHLDYLKDKQFGQWLIRHVMYFQLPFFYQNVGKQMFKFKCDCFCAEIDTCPKSNALTFSFHFWKKYYYNFQAVPKTFWQLLTELPLHIVKQKENIFSFTYMCKRVSFVL